jgi:diguanylate cyclase (GGDEF)-like protein
VQRYKQESAVALLDIDHFTRFNELHGRTQGDVLLKEVAGLLVGRVRGSDVVMRYDGGRFVVLFTHTPELQALTKAKILQEQIAQYSFSVYDESLEGGLRITASLAVTGLGHPWLRAEPDVMKSLESALGEVKQHGPGQLTTGIPV